LSFPGQVERKKYFQPDFPRQRKVERRNTFCFFPVRKKKKVLKTSEKKKKKSSENDRSGAWIIVLQQQPRTKIRKIGNAT
jgi:hypothetical protein